MTTALVLYLVSVGENAEILVGPLSLCVNSMRVDRLYAI